MTELATVRSEETQKSQVDNETTERFIAEKHIGERIKRLRLKKSMGLVELGRHTGLSASFLSQLETGRVVPTLRNLARIAMVFSKFLLITISSRVPSHRKVHDLPDHLGIGEAGFLRGHGKLLSAGEPWVRIRFDDINLALAR
jgi:transcriptional regulator with XRE-family HTH domain